MKRIVILLVLVFLVVPVSAQTAEGLACELSSLDGLTIGDSVVIRCAPACTEWSVWGTGTYTEDSDLCTAAAHSGIITLEEGGNFVVTIAEGQESYLSSEQNGIVSSSWGSWDSSMLFSPVPMELDWLSSAQEIEGETGTFTPVSCASNGSLSTVWGTEIYTDDSSICSAAVHLGLITMAEGGSFNVSITDGQESYVGSSNNDVETLDYASWGRSFVLSPTNIDIEWSTAANELSAPVGTSIYVTCPADGTLGSLWGTDIYTDDSSICTTAVHQGLITADIGGQFIVTILGGLDSYAASDQNGVQSSDWTTGWDRSFMVGFWNIGERWAMLTNQFVSN